MTAATPGLPSRPRPDRLTSRLILLTDRAQLRLGRGLLRTVTECVEAGLRVVVVREHDEPPAARHALIAELARLPGLIVISGRIPDPAAHGLHLAAAQPAPAPPCNAVLPTLPRSHGAAGASVTPRYMRGRSCHSRPEVEQAAAEGLDYATLSPYAATPSKPGYGPPLPREEYAAHALPVYALGGITPANAAGALEAGAQGVAVMGAVMRAEEPAEIVEQLLREVGE